MRSIGSSLSLATISPAGCGCDSMANLSATVDGSAAAVAVFDCDRGGGANGIRLVEAAAAAAFAHNSDIFSYGIFVVLGF